MAFVRRRRRTALPAVLAATAAALIGVAWSSPAFANSTIDINPGNVPTTAAGFGDQNCDANFGGGPYADADVWVFVLPSNGGTAGDFVSVTAEFDTNGDGVADTTKTIPSDTPSGIATDNGTSKAWIKTDAGWKLIDATAVITGTVSDPTKGFNLTHTCPASGSPSTPPGVPSGSPSATVSPSSSVSSSSSPSGSVAPSPSTSSSSSTLPLTGTSLTPFIVAGVLLVAGGSVLVVMARRRRLNG